MGAEVSAARILKIQEDQGPGQLPRVLLGPPESEPIYSYDAPVVKTLLSFHPQTGRVMNVIPLTNRSQDSGKKIGERDEAK